MARDRAEGVRVAYVAATRARDLLWSRWWATIRSPPDGTAPATAGSGRSTAPSIRRPSGGSAARGGGLPRVRRGQRARATGPRHAGARQRRPGLHAFGSDPSGYGVVWWDPRRLGLTVQPLYGLRRDDLIQDPGRGIVERDRARYDQRLAERRAAQERGAQPSIRLRTATDWARSEAGWRRPCGDRPRGRARRRDPGRSQTLGPRFGTLFTRRWRPSTSTRRPRTPRAGLQARLLGATADEVEAARRSWRAALAHPLMARGRGVAPGPLPP